MKHIRAKLLLVVGVFALSGLFLVACGGGDDDSIDEGPSTPGSSPQATRPPSDDGESEEEILVVMRDNLFEPKNIEIPVDKKVTISVKNEGLAVHNMRILSKEGEGKDFSSAALINPGSDDEFDVQFKKTGTYNFQCDYHTPQMAGTITVK